MLTSLLPVSAHRFRLLTLSARKIRWLGEAGNTTDKILAVPLDGRMRLC
ncbi:MAG: hypothetical protein ACYC3I_27295 [Gemmataceae bacterium]